MISLMDEKNIITNYVKALLEAPVSIFFFLLDLAGIYAVIRWVVDDQEELLVVLIFIFLVQVGNYLIFRKQQTLIEIYQDKILEFETSIPDLTISSVVEEQIGSNILLKVSELPEEPDYEELVEVESNALKEAFHTPEHSTGPLSPAKVAKILQQSLYRSKKDEGTYNQQCQEYLSSFNSYLRRNYLNTVISSRRRSMGFIVENTGKVPAEDIYIFLHFPDEIEFPTDDELFEIELSKKSLDPPIRPSVYTSWLKGIEALSQTFPLSMRDFDIKMPDVNSLSDPNVRGPFIEGKDSTEVSYEIKKLIQGFTIQLDDIEFLLSDDALGKTLEIPVQIHSSSLPQYISTVIKIAIEEGR